MEFADSLKGFSCFANGTDYGGTVTKGNLATPKRTLKDRRPGGTNLKMRTQHGWELDSLELTMSGLTEAMFGIATSRAIDGQQLIFRAAFEDEFDETVSGLELEVWGREEEFDIFGEMESEEDTEGKLVFVPARYTLTYAGRERWFYDIRSGVIRKNGIDLTAGIRAALGRA